MGSKRKKVLVVATSRKTKGGITSVVKAHESGEQWEKFRCKWIETHIDKNLLYKLIYLIKALVQFNLLIPFYNIVHIHVANDSSVKRKMLFFNLSIFYKKKIIIHFHPPGPDVLLDKKIKPLYLKLFKKSNQVLVLSEQWKRWLDELMGIRDKVQVLYNPCPIVNNNLDENKQNYILFAGYLIERKGYIDFIKAFSEIANKYPQWDIVLAGTGEIDSGKNLSRQLGIENQVKFLGWIDGRKKEQVFKSASIFCLPSYGEGFPMAVLDAWAYGLPVITTPVGGLPDIIKDNFNGMLFPPGDINELSKKMDVMMSNKLVRQRIAKQSKKMASTTFNAETINKQLGEIYLKLI